MDDWLYMAPHAKPFERKSRAPSSHDEPGAQLVGDLENGLHVVESEVASSSRAHNDGS